MEELKLRVPFLWCFARDVAASRNIFARKKSVVQMLFGLLSVDCGGRFRDADFASGID